jgi:epoxide hydrolase-like predicted phosphatase
MSNAIRAVVFDVGGVLVRTFDHMGRREWEQRLNLAPGEIEAIVLNGEIGHRAQRGEITDAALWNWANTYLDLGPDLDAFRRDFWKGDAVDRELVTLIRGLRNRYQTAIISNATDALLPTLEKYGLLPEFDLVVGSAYEGVMKPDPLIYRRALARLGRTPDEAVFIDDSPRNISGAMAVGMRAILFTQALNLVEELATLGVRAGAT